MASSSPLVVEVGEPLARDSRFLGWLSEHGIDHKYVFRVEMTDEEIVAFAYKAKPGGGVEIEDGKLAVAAPLRVAPTAPLPDWVVGACVPDIWRASSRPVAISDTPGPGLERLPSSP